MERDCKSPDIERVPLDDVQVRPVCPHERARWDELMAAHHYLGFRQMPGESIRYVAEHQGTWLSLLGWASGSFKCGPRDRWIGWIPEVQWRRLPLVVCNQRFLVLPHVRVPNLASRVLSLNVKRLSRDWQAFHGHPVALAETFVDRARFTGACYRAAGWIELGETQGFGRNAGRYYHHGQVKAIFVFPLVRKVQSALASSFLPPRLQTGALAIVDLNEVQIDGQDGLIAVLRGVQDTRKRRGVRHEQVSILATAVAACLAGSRSFAAIADWASHQSQDVLERLGCRWNYSQVKYVPPSEPTLRRTLKSVDAEDVDRRVGAWLARQANGKAVALDGKTLRGSRTEKTKAVHLVSALLHGEGVVIGQTAVSEKSNEITAVKPLLDPLDLEGKVVTADAMHAQVEHARYIVEDKKADYVLTVKANQPTLMREIDAMDDGLFSPSIHDC